MMWGWSNSGSNAGNSNRNRFLIAASIAAIVLGLMFVFGWRFGGIWWIFLLFPIFGGWGRSRRRDRERYQGERYESRRYSAQSAEDDKRKNDEWFDEYEEEKPKRTEYRLGDDGELVEVEPEREERHYQPRQSARRVNGDDPIEYI